MTYIDSSGSRVTADNSYLTPDVLSRPNLKIITKATVTRILFHKSRQTVRASGVEFVQAGRITKLQVQALTEVVVWSA